MRSENKNDRLVHEAITLQNSGHWQKAASLLQRAGNQYRNPAEKEALWEAANRARRIAASD